MKLFYLILVLFLFSCNVQPNNKLYLLLYINSYNNRGLYSYKHYNSLNGELKIFEKTSTTDVNKIVNIKVSDKEILNFYNSYKNLKLRKEKLCFNEYEGKYDSEIILSISKEPKNEINFKNFNCTQDENKKNKILMISLEFLKFIKTTEEYKIAFPEEFEKM